MRYFVLKHVATLPAGFGGVAKGPVIRILSKYQHDAGLLEHEKFHVRQWWAWFLPLLVLAVVLAMAGLLPLAVLAGFVAPLAHPAAYRCARRYRRWSEVRAYRIQLRQYGPSASAEFAAKALAEKYDLGIGLEEARRLLGR